MTLSSSAGGGRGAVEVRENYNPTTLGAMALWLDFDDAAHVWQDVAGLTPATIGTKCQRVDDKSGNARHFMNASATTSPSIANFEGTKLCADFGSSQTNFLASALPSTLSFLYKGGPFTIIISFKRLFSNQFQTIFDSANFSSFNDGMTIFYNSPTPPSFDYFQMGIYNSRTHSSGGGKNATDVPDAEYIVMVSDLTNRGNADGVLFAANDVTTGYMRINDAQTITAGAVGSPASSDGPYPITLGATANGNGFGWAGYIRRVWIWPTFLNSTDRDTAITKIQL